MSNALRDSLRGALDYAGLFPPAGLPIRQAIENYAAYRESAHRDLLGSFVCPSNQLTELESLMPGGGEWPLAVVGVGGLPRDFEAVLSFNVRMAGVARIRSFAIAFDGESPIPGGLKTMQGKGVRVYLEGPWSGAGMESVKYFGLQAQLRFGGAEESSFPSTAVLAAWLRKGAELELAFRASAGMPSAVRGVRFLDYGPDETTVRMHGFLNLMAATAAAQGGGPVEQLLECEEPGKLLPWLGRPRLLEGLVLCSFAEPVAELQELRLL
jgi:hypothetical protein